MSMQILGIKNLALLGSLSLSLFVKKKTWIPFTISSWSQGLTELIWVQNAQ